jgi:hypothetical protein
MEERKLIRETLPSNSDRPRKPVDDATKSVTEKPKQSSVVKKGARKRRKTFGEKFKEAFMGDESKNVGDYVIHDVLVPALKSTISDVVTGGIEMALFGERRSGRSIRDKGKTYTSYNSYYGGSRGRDDRDDRGSRDISRSGRARHDFDDVIFDSRAEAEDVLTHLVDLTLDYGIASVGDFYELSGIESQFTDNKYGWTSLRGACTDRVRNGYVIRLPQPRPID